MLLEEVRWEIKPLRRAPALDALKSGTGFQGFFVLGLLIQV